MTFGAFMLALTSLTGGGRSVGIFRLRTQAMEFCSFSDRTSRNIFARHKM
jgi:hypothetical protein